MRKFHSSEYINALASGRNLPCGGLFRRRQAGAEARAEAKNGVDIAYAIPKDGAQLWFDNLAIPRDARNVGRGARLHQLLAEAGGGGEEFELHLLCQRQSREPEIHRPAILDDKTIYPDDAVMKRLYTISAHDAKTQRLMNRLWTRIKTGK